MKPNTCIEMPTTTYNLTFYRRDGEVDSTQTYSAEETAAEFLAYFDEPDSAEIYSRITLTAYDWTTGEERIIKELAF